MIMEHQETDYNNRSQYYLLLLMMALAILPELSFQAALLMLKPFMILLS